ncbi:MAG TPA: hypothetical protein VFD32_15255 [Dehalococcoidia bacterium]|nr:hypothetical protein [Dehalococcoidia bacterium]
MLKNDIRNDGTEQTDDEVIGYGALAGGVFAGNLLRAPAVLPSYVPSYVPTRSSGEEIPQFRALPASNLPVAS